MGIPKLLVIIEIISFLISNFRLVLNVLSLFLGDSPTSVV
jgi:hypothetical protein